MKCMIILIPVTVVHNRTHRTVHTVKQQKKLRMVLQHLPEV